MKIPCSIDNARQLIKDYPELFKNCFETEKILSNALDNFCDQRKKYINQDQPMIDEIKERLKELSTIKK